MKRSQVRTSLINHSAFAAGVFSSVNRLSYLAVPVALPRTVFPARLDSASHVCLAWLSPSLSCRVLVAAFHTYFGCWRLPYSLCFFLMSLIVNSNDRSPVAAAFLSQPKPTAAAPRGSPKVRRRMAFGTDSTIATARQHPQLSLCDASCIRNDQGDRLSQLRSSA